MNPPLQGLQALLLRVALFGGTAYGVTDAELPALVRVALPLGASLVLAVLTFAEHQTAQTNAAVSVQAAQVAAQAAQAAQAAPARLGTPAGPLVAPEALDAAMAAVGAVVEAQRAGVLATGRHETTVAPRLSPDDFPTQAFPAVTLPAVPTTPGA